MELLQEYVKTYKPKLDPIPFIERTVRYQEVKQPYDGEREFTLQKRPVSYVEVSRNGIALRENYDFIYDDHENKIILMQRSLFSDRLIFSYEIKNRMEIKDDITLILNGHEIAKLQSISYSDIRSNPIYELGARRDMTWN